VKLSSNEEFAMVMFAIMSNQAESWAYVIKGKVQQEFKFRLENYLAAAKSLRRFLEEKQVAEIAEDLGQPFSDLMLMIKNAPSVERRCEIMQLIKDLTEGNLKIVDEDANLQLSERTGGEDKNPA